MKCRILISIAAMALLGMFSYSTPVQAVASENQTLTYPTSFPWSGTVGAGGLSTYQVNGVTASTAYTVSIDANKDADLYVYTNNTKSTLLCSSVTGTGVESCNATATTTSIYIEVNGSKVGGNGSSYTLNVVEVVTGEPAENLTLAYGVDFPHSGTVDNVESTYNITGVAASFDYTVSMTGLSDNADLYVYDDAAMTTLLCSSINGGTTNESCTATSTYTSLYVVVDGGAAPLGATFTLDIVLVTLPAENLTLTLGTGDLPHSGTSDNVESTYTIASAVAAREYSVSLTGLNDNADLYVYDDAAKTTLLCSSINGGTTNESCLATSAYASFYVLVDGLNTVAGASYTLDVSTTALYTRAYGTADLPDSAIKVGTGENTYTITGVTASTAYTVSLSGANNDVDLYVYDPTRTTLLCSSTAGTTAESCDATATSSILYVVVDGFQNNTSYTLDVVLAGGGPPSENLALAFGTGDLPHAGTVDTSESTYQITGVTASTTYTVALTGLDDNVNLNVYDDAVKTTLLCSSANGGTTNESCNATAASTSLYVFVSGSATASGANFTLNVTEVPATPPAENLTLAFGTGDLPHAGTVDTSESSYQITGVTTAFDYSVALTGLDDNANLYVYDDAVKTTLLCSSANGGTTSESCTATAASTSLYVFVNGSATASGANFTLNVTEVGGGLPAENLTLAYGTGDLPHAGTVDTSESSYQITGVVSGFGYTVALTGLDDNANLYVYDDAVKTTLLCSSTNGGTTSESCAATAASTSLYVFVDGSGTAAGANFSLNATVVVPPAESLTLAYGTGDLPHAGTVNTSESFYQITGVSTSIKYTVTLTGLNANANLYVYNDVGKTGLLCSSAKTGTANESCVATAASTSLYVYVIGSLTTSGAYFTLNVSEVAGPPAESLTLAFGTADLPHSGTVNTTESTYLITGVTATSEYTIQIVNPSDDADLYVYDDSSKTTLLCGSSGTGDNVCLATSAYTSLYVVVDGTPTLNGAVFTLKASEVPTGGDPHSWCRTYCHSIHNSAGGGNIPLTQYSQDSDMCLTCHDTDSVLLGSDGKTPPRGQNVHNGTKHQVGDITSCWDCHDHYGESKRVGLDDQYNLKLIPYQRVSKYPLPGGEVKTIVYDKVGGQEYGDRVDDCGPGYPCTPKGVCQVCHTATTFNLSTEVDGSTIHNDDADCSSCHKHDSATSFAATGCTGCHSTVQDDTGNSWPSRRAAVLDFDEASHHITFNATNGYTSGQDIDSADCEVCHDQSTHKDGVVDLYNLNDSSVILITGDVFTSSTEAAKLTNFCLGCHDGVGNPLTPPLSDGVTPPVIDPTTWTNGTHNSIGGISCFGDGAYGCHSSGHGSKKRRMLAPYNVAPSSDPGANNYLYEEEEGFCFNCHDSDGPSSIDMKTRWTTPIRWVQQGLSVTGTTNPNFNDRHDVQYEAQQVSGAKIECTDCHNPHEASPEYPFKLDPDPGRTPVTPMSGSIVGKTWTEYWDFDPSLPSKPQTYFCLDCHDNTFPAAVTPPTIALANIDYAWDQDNPLSPNPDMHGTTDTAGEGIVTGLQYETANTVILSCEKCHNPHPTVADPSLVDLDLATGGSTPVANYQGNDFMALKDIVTDMDGVTPLKGGASGSMTYLYSYTDNSGGAPYVSVAAFCLACHARDSMDTKTNCFVGCHGHTSGKF